MLGFVHLFEVLFCEEGKDIFNVTETAQLVLVLNVVFCKGRV